jgi:hypothetical protein
MCEYNMITSDLRLTYLIPYNDNESLESAPLQEFINISTSANIKNINISLRERSSSV